MFNLDGIIKVIINNEVIYINESSLNNKNNHLEEKTSCIKSSVEEGYYIYDK